MQYPLPQYVPSVRSLEDVQQLLVQQQHGRQMWEANEAMATHFPTYGTDVPSDVFDPFAKQKDAMVENVLACLSGNANAKTAKSTSGGSTDAPSESGSDGSDGSGTTKAIKTWDSLPSPEASKYEKNDPSKVEPMRIPTEGASESSSLNADDLRVHLEESVRRLVQQLDSAQENQRRQQQLQQGQLLRMQHLLQQQEHNTAAITAAAWDMLWQQSGVMPCERDNQMPYPGVPGYMQAELASNVHYPYVGPVWQGAPMPTMPQFAMDQSQYQGNRMHNNSGASKAKAGGKGKAQNQRTSGKGGNASKPQAKAEADRVKLRSQVKADCHRTVVTLKINRLGFEAEQLLKEHYSKFGKVDYVCVPLKVNRVAATATSPALSHLRPSGLGFVVMSKEEEVQAILAAGNEQQVCGKTITVRAFKQGENDDNEDGKEAEQ